MSERVPLALLRLGIIAVFTALLAGTQSDPDLWGHLRFGADIAATGQVPTADRYAFTSGPTWVNQSWLADLLMHIAFASGGASALIVAKLGVAAAILLVVVGTLRRAGVRGAMLALLLFLAVTGLYPSIPTIRPQLLSLLLFAIILRIQVHGSDRPVSLLAVPPIMMLWANLHGAWILGLAEIALWTAGEVIRRTTTWRRRGLLVSICVLAALATAGTPYRTTLWWHLYSALGASVRDVTEWRGLLETGSAAVAVWIALVGLAAYVAWAEGVQPGQAIVIVWLAWASWRVRRLLPFLSLATVSLLAPQLAALSRRGPLGLGTAAPPRRSLVLVLVGTTLALIGTCVWTTARAVRCIRLDHAVEADARAGAFLARNRLRGRLLVYSDWGQYVIWHFAPALRVSIDGRREFAYPLTELARHNRVYWNPSTVLDDVEALSPDYIWVPASLPVLKVLTNNGWATIFATGRSVVLERPGRSPSTHYVAPPFSALPECFPDAPYDATS